MSGDDHHRHRRRPAHYVENGDDDDAESSSSDDDDGDRGRGRRPPPPPLPPPPTISLRCRLGVILALVLFVGSVILWARARGRTSPDARGMMPSPPDTPATG